MRPALQRLLARPSSLDFLHCLVGTPCTTTNIRNRQSNRQDGRKCFVRSHAGVAAKSKNGKEEGKNEGDTNSATSPEGVSAKKLRRRGQRSRQPGFNRQKAWTGNHTGGSKQNRDVKKPNPQGVPLRRVRILKVAKVQCKDGEYIRDRVSKSTPDSRTIPLKKVHVLKVRFKHKEYDRDMDTKGRSDAEDVPLENVQRNEQRVPEAARRNRRGLQIRSNREGSLGDKFWVPENTRDVEQPNHEGDLESALRRDRIHNSRVRRSKPRIRFKPKFSILSIPSFKLRYMETRQKVLSNRKVPIRLKSLGEKDWVPEQTLDIEEGYPIYQDRSNSQAIPHGKPRIFTAIEEENMNHQCAQDTLNRVIVLPEINHNHRQDEVDKERQRYYGRWGLHEWSSVELDFESGLEQKTDSLRLLDDCHFEHDMRLWAFLLDYRQKKDGQHGVAMIWESFRTRNLKIPEGSSSLVTDKLLMAFLGLGFEKPAVMENICQYAEEAYALYGACWKKLYFHVVLHFLTNGTHDEALHWHRRLFHIHPPNEWEFHKMCKSVARGQGNLPALQTIYKESRLRTCYKPMISMLCHKGNFMDALMWHDFFVGHGDLPKSFSEAETLIRHLQTHHVFEAQRVIKSLASLKDFVAPVDPDYAGRFTALEDIDTNRADMEELRNPVVEQHHPPFQPLQEISKILQKEHHANNPIYNVHMGVQKPVELDHSNRINSLDELDGVPGWTNRPKGGDVQPAKPIHISREMMNLIHGEHYGIKPATYNDQLGARWFASSWVSLDLAVSLIHALGVLEIGPLSLHAIALREPGARDISMRIKQLKDLGISIGNSVFSQAVKYFAQKREDTSLESLLSSDQHPNEYENFELQEKLLMEYLHARDWVQYRRTLAILSFRSASPEYERANYILRTHVGRQDVLAIYDTLSLMKLHGQRVSGKTVSHIIRLLLAPRKPGHRPDLNHDINIRQTIGILKTLSSFASQVRPRSWIEILRRLGMLGQFRDLEHLCLFLVDVYHPSNPESSINYHALPPAAKITHHLHPYRLMFSPTFQKAVVEWGFIHSLKVKSFRQISQTSPSQGPNTHTSYNDDIPMPNVTFGIHLLKTLASKGVWVDFGPIRKAIVHRMIVCYGPLKSNRIYNRNASITLGLNDGVPPRQSFRKMAAMVDNALGANVFENLDIKQLIRLRVRKVMMKRARQRQKIKGEMKRRMRGLDGLRSELR